MDPEKQMEIELRCSKLLADFCYYNDHRMVEELAALLVPDVVMKRLGSPVRGALPAAQALAAGSRPADLTTAHVLANTHFTRVDETSAEAVIYMMTYLGKGGDDAPKPVHFRPVQGTFLEIVYQFHNTPAGWRIGDFESRQVLVSKDLLTQGHEWSSRISAAGGNKFA